MRSQIHIAFTKIHSRVHIHARPRTANPALGRFGGVGSDRQVAAVVEVVVVSRPMLTLHSISR